MDRNMVRCWTFFLLKCHPCWSGEKCHQQLLLRINRLCEPLLQLESNQPQCQTDQTFKLFFSFRLLSSLFTLGLQASGRWTLSLKTFSRIRLQIQKNHQKAQQDLHLQNSNWNSILKFQHLISLIHEIFYWLN